MPDTTWIYIAIGCFLFITFFVGIRKGKHATTIKDFALANRSLGTGPLIITLLATMLSAKYAIAKVTDSQEFGISLPLGQVIGYTSIALLLTITIFPRLLRLKDCYTLGDVMGTFYGARAQLFTGIVTGLTCIFFVVAQLLAVSRLSEHVGLHKQYVLVIIGLAMTLYALGGMRAVAATDIFQFILVMGGFIVIMLSVFSLDIVKKHGGGLLGVFQAVHKQYPDHLIPHDFSLVRGILSTIIFSTILWSPPIIQRVLMARSPTQLQQTILGFAVFYPVLRFVLTVIGFGLLLTYKAGSIPRYEILNVIAGTLCGGAWWAEIVLVLMVLSLAMSTGDSFLNSLVVIISRDIIQPKSDQAGWSIRRWAPVMTLGSGLLCIALSFVFQDLNHHCFFILCLFALGGFLVPLIAGLMGLKGHSYVFWGSTSAFAVGSAVLIWLADQGYIPPLDTMVFLSRKMIHIFPFTLAVHALVFLLLHYQVFGNGGWVTLETPKPKTRISMRGEEVSFRNLFIHPLVWAKDKIERYGSQPTLLGFFLAIVMMIPESASEQMETHYQTIFMMVRFVGLGFCAFLMLHNIWQHPFKLYFAIYWFTALTYLLPFFYTLQWLYNPDGAMALLELVIGILLLHLLVDWRTYCLLSSLGTMLAFVVYMVSGGSGHLSFNNVWNGFWGVLFSMLVGFLFASRKEQVSTNRVRRNKIWTNAFSHDLDSLCQSLLWNLCSSENEESLEAIIRDKAVTTQQGGKAGDLVIKRADCEKLMACVKETRLHLDECTRQNTAFKELIFNDYINIKDIIKVKVSTLASNARAFLPPVYQSRIKVATSTDFEVSVYPPLMKNVLVNLVKNACWHGGATEVIIGWDVDRRQLYVKDNGSGIPPSVEPYIFDMYYTTGTGRLGIGLPFIKTVLQAMDISITLSTDEKGTTFFLLFPPV